MSCGGILKDDPLLRRREKYFGKRVMRRKTDDVLAEKGFSDLSVVVLM